MNLTKLSAAKLEAEYTKRNEASSRINQAFIDAGRGHEYIFDIRAIARGTDALADEFVRCIDASHEVNEEMKRRREYHGSLKPIKTP